MRAKGWAVRGVLILAGAFFGCKGGHYQSAVSKLHSGISGEDVVSALGKPYGDVNGMIAYYDAGQDTILAVQPNKNGECNWVLLEVPPSGIPDGFTYYKVRDSSGGGAPVALGTTVFKAGK